MDHIKSILVAEEKGDCRDVLVYILQRSGYRVIETDDEPERIAEAMSNTGPDAILLDTDPLGEKAEGFVAQLQTDFSSRRIPIICEATHRHGLVKSLRKAGASEVLLKPYDLTDLPSILRKCLAYNDRSHDGFGGKIMMPDVFYRGYRIVSAVEEIPDTEFWKGKGAVVEPADASGLEKVHPVVAIAYFRTEKTATDFIVAEAKKWIDGHFGRPD